MRNNDFDLSNDELSIIKHYEEAHNKGRLDYFDVSDMELVIEHYLQLGDTQKAQDALRVAFKLHPDNSYLQCKRARIYINLGKLDDALELMNRYEEPNNPAHIFTKAEIYLKIGQKTEAIELFRLLVDDYTDNDLDDVCLDIVSILHAFQDYHNSQYFIKKGLTKTPKNLDLLIEYAVGLEQLSEFDKAIEVYNRILDIDAYKSPAWFCLGLLYFNKEQYAKALEAFDFCTAINNNDTIAWLQKAHCHFNLDQYESSIKAYRKYLTEYPDDSTVLSFLAECYENCDLYEQALYYFSEAARINPLNAEAWLGAAVCMIEKESFDDAFKYIQKAIHINPDSAENYAVLGEILDKLELIQDAKEAYLRSLDIEPKQADTWKELGGLHMQTANFDDAITCYEFAYNLDNSIDKLTLLLSMAHFATHNIERMHFYYDLAKQQYSNAREVFLTVFPDAKELLDD